MTATALASDTVEGFCELMAWKYMESRQEPFEMQVIRENPYTRGQITVLLQAENQYGFNTVLEWIKSGEDSKLELGNLEEARRGFAAERTSVEEMLAANTDETEFSQIRFRLADGCGDGAAGLPACDPTTCSSYVVARQVRRWSPMLAWRAMRITPCERVPRGPGGRASACWLACWRSTARRVRRPRPAAAGPV